MCVRVLLDVCALIVPHTTQGLMDDLKQELLELASDVAVLQINLMEHVDDLSSRTADLEDELQRMWHCITAQDQDPLRT